MSKTTTPAIDLAAIVRHILTGYSLPLFGDHGIGHWGRVLENGQRLASLSGANLTVVQLFAIFHDSRRINEYDDPRHGTRGAALARELHGQFFQLSDSDLDLLTFACEHHTDMVTWPDATIQTCWDADRLDLLRVGIEPNPRYLNTTAAKSAEMLTWANTRARKHVVPEFVKSEWNRCTAK